MTQKVLWHRHFGLRKYAQVKKSLDVQFKNIKKFPNLKNSFYYLKMFNNLKLFYESFNVDVLKGEMSEAISVILISN